MEDKLPFDSAIHIKTPPLSEDILIKIKEVKAILSEEQRNNKWLNDDQIHRNLIARKFDIKQTSLMIETALKWREAKIPKDGSFHNYEEWKTKWERKFYFEGLTGKIRVPCYDKFKRPFVIFDNTVQNTDSNEDQLNYLAWNLEYAIEIMNKDEVDKINLFIHLNNFSFFNMPPMNVTKETIHMLSLIHAERLGNCVLYKPPYIFSTLFSTLNNMGLIDARTASKIVFINGSTDEGSENDKTLKSIIGDDWRLMSGAEQPIKLVEGQKISSPGYDHFLYWDSLNIKFKEISLAKNVKEYE